MFKTEKDNNLDSRYYQNNEPVQSKFMSVSKKKYYLASADHNLDQLKEEQKKILTQFLIQLKGEYDELIRETTIKKGETEKLGKQIDMLEKMDKITKNKYNDMEENLNNMEVLIDLKKKKKEEEQYTKTTLQNRVDKMKEQILITRKEITEIEGKTKQRNKKFEMERLMENSIKEKVNQVYSKIYDHRTKNTHDRNENNLVLHYYQTIIDQKWAFIHSADERKAKQIKIAIDAKNDSQDKEEVEKRKVLHLYYLLDKFLRKKMEMELKENEVLEETFQTIRDITGNSNLKIMVDKILNKDKNYNLCVMKVSEKLNKIDILKSDINKQEEEFQKLRNKINEYNESNKQNNNETSNVNSDIIEEDELNMIREEHLLMEELKLMQEKHKNVKLVYEKVVDNIKQLCKIEKKDDTINITQSQVLNLNESKIADTSNMNMNVNNQSSFNLGNQVYEEELVKSYSEFLESTKKTIDGLFLIHPKEEFLRLMKEKGIEPVDRNQSIKKTRRTEKHASLGSRINHEKLSAKDFSVKIKNNANLEYGYSDDELKKEDDEIREEKEEIMKSFKAVERSKLLEALKTEKVEKDKK